MKLFGRNAEGHAKALVILAVVLLVSSGLCGIQVAILDSRRNGFDNLYGIFTLTGIAELGTMLISLLGMIVVLIAWAASRTFGKDDMPPKDGR